MKSYAKFSAIVLVMAVFIPASAFAADVDVYVEGAYTETDLHVILYADINGPNLCSFGVKLTYAPPLTVASAIKNEAVWYLGSETYMDPEVNPGDVVVIGGKLDPSNPTAGVGGARIKLGEVIFSHDDSTADFASLLGITYGRGDGTGDYKNFVATDGLIMDATNVSFGAIRVFERGDANEDGVLTNSDMFAVRQLLIDNKYKVHADCNNDGVLTNSDMFCIKGKL